MTPCTKIKKTIILRAAEYIKDEEFDLESYDLDSELGVTMAYGELWDYLSGEAQDFREGEEETEIYAPCSRHYESKSVAAKMFDGSWVGWTYWYGGGKHGDPESIPWIDDAYELDCVEREVTMTVRDFTKTNEETKV